MYSYKTSTVSNNTNQIYYWFDWDDGNVSGWLGPYETYNNVTAKHQWCEAGNFFIRVKAKDVYGFESNWSEPLEITIDGTPPELTILDNPIILWPPNHNYHIISVSDFILDIFDEIDGDLDFEDVVITNVSSDEPENGNGDGNTVDDIVILDNQTVKLRSERKGNGDGRVYTINFKVSDFLDNTAYGSYQIWVPHSKHSDAIDDGVENGYIVFN